MYKLESLNRGAIKNGWRQGLYEIEHVNASFRLAFARLVTHYWRHKGWLEDDILVRSAGLLSGIPGILITPWRLNTHWSGSQLVLVDEAGHDARDPGMSESIVAATDRFALPV